MNAPVPDKAAMTAVEQAWARMPTHWPTQAELLHWCQSMNAALAAVLILAGIVYLVFGYAIFRFLVVANAMLIGSVLGATLGNKAGSWPPGAVIGAVLLGALAWPIIHWAVAVLGAVSGFLVGASLWMAAGLDPPLKWAGGMIGFMTCGLLTFILFRGCVILFTSLQGSAMLLFGILGLACKYPQAFEKINHLVATRASVLPLAIFIPMVLAMLYQQSHHPAPAPPAKK